MGLVDMVYKGGKSSRCIFLDFFERNLFLHTFYSKIVLYQDKKQTSITCFAS